MRLVHVSDTDPGLRRRRCGSGFVYLDRKGRRVKDASALRRIRDLAIPPAWSDVWICAHARGHLQATGRDARGRKQYRYHQAWSDRRGAGKFGRLAAFGKNLPKLRRRLRRDLSMPALSRENILAVAVSLLGATLIRIGNKKYARDNDSYGLTTLHTKHVEFIRRGAVRFHFIGKSGKTHDLVVDDSRLVRLLRRCNELPGRMLFQYYDADGKRRAIDSGHVNAYLRSIIGADFSAKDFRTWGATVLAVAEFLRAPDRADATGAQAAAMNVTRKVASALGNTAAVCRASYIHPKVYADWNRLNGLLRSSQCRIATQPRKLEALTLKIIKA